MKVFRGSFIVTLVALIVAFLYGSWNAVLMTAILGVLEISLSFDNAIVNSRILEKMSKAWQSLFLTLGVLIAVVGMRLIVPLVIVSVSARLNPISALRLALEKGDPAVKGTYGYILGQAHPAIAAFGAMFLLMLALSFFFTDREYWWFRIPEKILFRMGVLDYAPVIVSGVLLLLSAQLLSSNHWMVLLSGVIGILTFIIIDGFGNLMSSHGTLQEANAELGANQNRHHDGVKTAAAVGKAALVLFIYLEIVDASFSFDGVIGAFAITADPVIILLGLGLIGAMFVRSLTVYLVRKGTLNDLVYLDHGAHWAILVLAIMLLITIKYEINNIFIGLIGAAIILVSLLSSVLHNRKISQ